ncbi:hypothetical protein BJX76DRAFT_335128 [Aspergillus varians]
MRKLAPTKLFTPGFVPKHTISPIAHRYLTAKQHPIQPKVQYMCDNRDPNTLWWRVSTSRIYNYKRVVRSRAARKARAAFTEELKTRGFDAEGRRLGSDTSGSAFIDGFSGNMTGTLSITLAPACIEGNYAAFQKEMKTTMDALIHEQQKIQITQNKRSERGQRSARPSANSQGIGRR